MSSSEPTERLICPSCNGRGYVYTGPGGQSRARCSVCKARISYRPDKSTTVSVEGTDHTEVSQVASYLDDLDRRRQVSLAPAHVHAGSPILILVTILGSLLGALLFIGGLFLAFAQRFAETKFTLLGNQFSSTSVGVSMAFIGAVLVIFTFRSVLRSLNHLAGLPG